ncbi:MAG: TIM barrel protein [Corynebacterium sp.]|uniref:hydroxypyruvate isomerase family protein n=1 Tax=uncultured Corynebacterium sp. TaxID=159447 RepID=UPI0017D23F14|nr:TIM barrel protein [uncultured Corynebacterium sp.]NLZ58144.1 TIM barrel protein [Corynebacterium sp.]
MPKFSANLSLLFTELPFLERFQAAADTGLFDAVEFQFPYEHDLDKLTASVHRAGLPVALINAPPGDSFGLAALETTDFTESIEVALHYATTLGASKLHVMAGIAPTTPDVTATYVRNVRTAAAMAAQQGVLVVVEPINHHTVPGYFLRDLGQAISLIRDIPNAKILFDIFHVQQIHGDLSRHLTALHDAGLLGHVQVASVPARTEPGTGEVNDAHIFQLLDSLPYTGAIGAEYHPAGTTVEGLGWLGAL